MPTHSFQQIAHAFKTDGYNLCRLIMGEKPTPKTLKQVVAAVHQQIDMLNDSFMKHSSEHDQPVACQKGCNWCCHQLVLVLPHEIIGIASYLTSQFKGKAAEEILEKARKKHATIDAATGNPFHTKSPCTFLKDGLCTIYPVRPMGCRTYLSMSKASCQAEYKQPSGETFPALFELPLIAGRSLNEGIVIYLKEHGIQADECSLDKLTELVFSGEDTTVNWLSGTFDISSSITDTSYLE